MAKYSEMVALLEYMDRKSPQKQPKAASSKVHKIKRFDLVELLRAKKEETELLEKFLDEQTKLKKKDEKKEEKKRQFIGIEWYIIGLLSYPVLMYFSNNLPAVLK